VLLPKTRLDRLVGLRKRTEDGALSDLASARRALWVAQDRLAGAIQQSRADHRGVADSAFWVVEEAAHRRALQVARTARVDVSQAAASEATAREGWVDAHRDTEVVRRVADRKRAEQVKDAQKLESRQLDDLGTLGHQRNRAARASHG
jgi:flagellar export protein FliJ